MVIGRPTELSSESRSKVELQLVTEFESYSAFCDVARLAMCELQQYFGVL